jgi:hypothetical protein
MICLTPCSTAPSTASFDGVSLAGGNYGKLSHTMVTKYISPITKIHSTFAEAKDFFEKFGGVSIFDNKESLGIHVLVQGKRNLIAGEPGVGKSLLLHKMQEHLQGVGLSAPLINLRDNDAVQQIDVCLSAEMDPPKALLLDALDEIKSSLFPTVLQKIEEISGKYPDLSLYISGRWVFVSRYANSFPEFRFITIAPFTRPQIREYLVSSGRSEADVDALLNRVMSFSHQMLVIQIPRYLSYLGDYLKEKGVDAAAKVSRNDLFEYFIYKKLELEERKLNEDKRAITKRVLEKLALTMEAYQTNIITKDELMTFFDDLKSDLKLVAYVVAYLLRSKIALDTPYWRQKLIAYAADKNENGVLQRHALLALEELDVACIRFG